MIRGAFPAAIALCLLAFVLVAQSSGGAEAGTGPPQVPPEIQADFDADGEVEVVVALENEDVLNALRARLRQRGNGQAQREAADQFRGRINEVVTALPSDGSSVEPYDQFGAFSITVRDQRVLDFLSRHPLVKGLEPVRAVDPLVAQSMPFINQPTVAGAGLTGAATSVAIIDTGVNFSHSFFGSCTAPGVPASCRVPVAMEFGDADGNLEDDLGHGTNVAGIAGSVAPGASLLSLDVFTRTSSGWSASTTDILEGLNWVIANGATYNTKSVNLSLGGSVYSSQTLCDGQSSATLNAFSTLRTNGVLPVVASGNNANKDGVTWPGCVTGAHAVGAVYDADYGPKAWSACSTTTTPDDATTAPDKVTCFSNSHPTLLDSLAPGTFIDVAGTINFSGTSMAAPHVAGAVAVMGAAGGTLTEIESALVSTGPLVTDTNNVTKRRLDLHCAVGNISTLEPLIISLPVTSATVGSAYSYQATACGSPSYTWELLSGPPGMTIESATGLVSYSPLPAHVGDHPVSISAANSEGTVTQDWTLSVSEVPPVQLYFSLGSQATLSGTSMADEDIVAFDGANFSQFFDGSDVGLGSMAISAFEIVDDDEILLVFRAATSIPGISGTVDDSDIVRFTGTTGPNTSGSFSLYFDGSNVGLAGGTFSDSEKIDALNLLDNGHVLISTNGTPSVSGVSGAAAQDLLRFTPTALGANTAGSWAMHWDGSDVGLSTTDENIDGAGLADGDLYLSTIGNFSVSGASGADEDVFVCTEPTTGGNTACGSWSLFFDGSAFGLGSNDLFAIEVPSVPVAPDITSTPSTTAVVGEAYSYQATASGSTPITWALTENPAGMTIDQNSGLVSWTPQAGQVGQHTVEIEATNGAGSDTQTWTIDVGLPPAPVITSTPGTTATVDDLYSYQATATGAGPITWELTTFPDGMTVDPNTGLVSWTPDSSDIGDHSVTLAAANIGGTTPQSWTVTVGDQPVAPPAQLYFALNGTQPFTVGSLTGVMNEDIVAFDGSNFSLFFDGSAEGLASFAIDAADVISSDQILMSFTAAGTVDGITFDDSDVLRFTISTSTFEMYFDGSDVGLIDDSEDIDAVNLLDNGRLVLSTLGNYAVTNGPSGSGHDLLRFTPSSLGDTTAGGWRMYWDGSDVGLTTTGERLDGGAVTGGKLYLSTMNGFSVTGLSGADEDVFVCDTPTTGPNSACAAWSLFFDGSAYGLGAYDLVGISLP